MSVNLNIICLVCINIHYLFTKHLLRRDVNTFLKALIMVSVAVSKLGKTDLDQELQQMAPVTVIT